MSTLRGNLWVLVLAAIFYNIVAETIHPNPRIVENPTDAYVARNEPATLNCGAEGMPKPTITWYKDGVPVITSNEDTASHRMLLPNGQLFFLRIIHNKNNKPDVGTYYCNATNIHGSAISRNATLEIAVLRDEFETNPHSTKAAINDDIVLECNPPRGKPKPTILWKKDGIVIERDRRVAIDDSGKLTISQAQKTDTGTYVCVARNRAGERESVSAYVAVQEKPEFTEPPQDKEIQKGQGVEFKCAASGDPAPTIAWRREEGEMPLGRYNVREDGTLELKLAEISDEGVYICRASNPVGYKDAQARLTVQSLPEFTITPRDKTVGVGRTVSLRCAVTGNPPPALYWNKEQSKVLFFPRQGYGRFTVSDGGTLKIEDIRRSDDGIYLCQAVSVAGTAFARARITVQDVDPRPPPIIHQGPSNQTLHVSTHAMLQCQASGDPSPTIQWYKANQPLLANNPRFTLLASGTMQISDLRLEDTGYYQCKAVSETGETTRGAYLTVEASHTTVIHRTPEASTFPGPPSKPSILEINEHYVRLSWQPSENSGASPVTSYTMEYFSHETGEGWIVASNNIRGTSFTVNGLQSDTKYIFLVRARNSHGLSLPSPTTEVIRTKGGNGSRRTETQIDIPLIENMLSGDVVRMSEPEVVGSTMVKLTWTVLKSQQYIEGFRVIYREVDPSQRTVSSSGSNSFYKNWYQETVSSSRSTMYFLRHLRKWTWYEIRVQPFFLSVNGQASNIVRIKTQQDVPSAAPQKVMSRKFDNNSVYVEWKPPATENIHGVMRGYVIFLIADDPQYSRNITLNASTTSYMIGNLISGVEYKLQIGARTDVGVGRVSEATTIVIGQPPWFLPTIIGTVGGVLWIVLCVFVVWLYRRKRNKKAQKNSVVMVPVHKANDPNRMPNIVHGDVLRKELIMLNGGNSGNDQDYHTNSSDQSKVINVGDENVYNCIDGASPQIKTFYDKGHPLNVTPYATANLVNANNILNKQHSESAFRPIRQGIIDPQMHSGSSDSCLKPGISSESNTDNSRPNTDIPHDHYHYSDQVGSPHSESSEFTMDENGIPYRKNRGQQCKQPVLNFADLLPPPPEHPPPTDIDSPPDSPRRGNSPVRGGQNERYYDRGQHYGQLRSPLSPASSGSIRNYPQRGNGQYSDSDYRSQSPKSKQAQQLANGDHRTHSPRNYNEVLQARNMSQSPRHRTDSPKSSSQQQPPSYSEVSASENERGPTPPVRAYKLVPIHNKSDLGGGGGGGGMGGRYDSDRGPTPPVRMYAIHSPISPASCPGVCMDRGIQSSLPSLTNERVHSPMSARLEMGHHGGPQLSLDYRPESPVSEGLPDYAGDSDMEPPCHQRDCGTPDSSIGEPEGSVTGSMLASWASVTDNSDTCLSSRSSATSSDGSFFTEADFASAVAKAAELSGLTVVGSTVTDPKAGKKNRHRYRERAAAHRPHSPYSTDSNFSVVQHKPYPKANRKKQLQEQAAKYPRYTAPGDQVNPPTTKPKPPPLKAKPTLPQSEYHPLPFVVENLPSYSRPNFPTPSSHMQSPTSTNSYSSSSGKWKNLSTSPKTPPSVPSELSDNGMSIRSNPLAFSLEDDPPVA